MPDFSKVITQAYIRILDRPPDPGGLDNFNRLMNSGLTEAMMREALLRSAEFAEKNPGAPAAARVRKRPRRAARPKATRAR
jgi:hypothetical protein